ncbi:MAG: L-2-amino-thiazoline-4-carboxylic acid hydrolase [Eubacteriales bacterium]|nr:L-2-amino-thiazoline-4-carboxylic acid hydrolase [Eubacteriales bacterium]
MKYKFSYWYFFVHYIKEYLKEEFGKERAKDIIVSSKKEYRKLLNRAEDIGGRNPMAKNMYFAMVFLAFHVAYPETFDQRGLEALLAALYRKKGFTKWIRLLNVNNPRHFKMLKKKLLKAANWIDVREAQYPTSWKFRFPDVHRDGFYYEFTKCPIAEFFKKNGYDELTPLFCQIDYKNIELARGKLYREKTLATGDDVCDFWLVPDKVKNPR